MVPFLPEARDLSLSQSTQTVSGSHSVSCSLDIGNLFVWVKCPGHEADSWPPYSAEIRNDWSYTSSPVHGEQRDRFTSVHFLEEFNFL